jgi:hypothetical protein
LFFFSFRVVHLALLVLVGRERVLRGARAAAEPVEGVEAHRARELERHHAGEVARQRHRDEVAHDAVDGFDLLLAD